MVSLGVVLAGIAILRAATLTPPLLYSPFPIPDSEFLAGFSALRLRDL